MDYSSLLGERRPLSPSQTIDVKSELSEEGKRRVVAEVVSAKSYLALQTLLSRYPSALEGDVAAYVLLQAANLRDTLELEAMMDLGLDQATALMDAQEYVRGALLGEG